jgi:hypothetical protein
MTTFDERERAFEAAFAHDQEMRFLAIAYRNRALGLWAAAKLGKTGADAEAYAKDVVASGVKKAGDPVIVGKITADLQAAGVAVNRLEIEQKLLELLNEAVLAQKAAKPA